MIDTGPDPPLRIEWIPTAPGWQVPLWRRWHGVVRAGLWL